ncbi:MAG TPA: O-antigen ligase family protein [Pseudobacter sp.]|nr:O-antigen ligase family protein [Pseudobacter sp.]
MNNQGPYINKYLPIVLLYFFANSFLLPHGLLYTTLLTPIGLLWLARYPSFRHLVWFFPVAGAFAVVHYLQGVNLKYYFTSLTLIFTVYVFIICCYQFLRNCHTLRSLYKQVLLINFLLVIVAAATLPIPSVSEYFWYRNELTLLYNIRRLKLLSYEASYYSLLLVPVAMYYYLKLIFLRLPDPVTTALLVSIPLLLSFSFGILLGLIIAILLIMLLGIRRLINSRQFKYIFAVLAILVMAFAVLMLFFPDNVVGERLARVFSGEDTSFRGRTTDSYFLSWKIAEMKSIWFGAGPGQTKELGLDLFRRFYHFPALPASEVRIPNATADTLASYGILGLIIRFGLQGWFFFSTRVYRNYYRLGLFLFIFIYQFTGSYLTNVAEYAIWLLAFHKGSFDEFESTVHIEGNAVERQGR